MLVFLHDADDELKEKAYAYTGLTLESEDQLKMMPEIQWDYELLSSNRPETVHEMLALRESESDERMTHIDGIVVNDSGEVCGIVSCIHYVTDTGTITTFGPWIARNDIEDGNSITFGKAVNEFYDYVWENSFKFIVSVYLTGINAAKYQRLQRLRDNDFGIQKHVVGKYGLLRKFNQVRSNRCCGCCNLEVYIIPGKDYYD